MKRVTSINIKPASLNRSEAHNERRVKLDYILPNLQGQHEHWKTGVIYNRMNEIRSLYQEKIGQEMQKKAEPIREGVVVIKPETNMDDLCSLGKRLRERFGIDCFQIHIHRDEGHVVDDKEAAVAKALGNNSLEVGAVIINHHAHMIFDWQDKTTGRSFKLNRADMRDMQTITAEVLKMERGHANSKAIRLEAQEFKIFKQKLQDSASNELKVIEEQKKNLFPELKTLGDNYNQTLKELNISNEELKEWESKFWLLTKLNDLPWNNCSNGVQVWLNLVDGLKGIEVKTGKDGSVYFQLGDKKARAKDLSENVRVVVLEKIEKARKQRTSIRH